MISEFSRNNYSLFEIPECVWQPSFSGETDYTVWSVHTWVRDNRFLPSYQVFIKYSFVKDVRGLYRATVKNIWKRSDRLVIYCQGRMLEGIELLQAKQEIQSRLMRLLHYSTLRDKKITRYRFNYIASFPEGVLDDFDCHHESHDNINMRDICNELGAIVGDEWFTATDDRVDNLTRLPRLEHKFLHFANGDANFYPYLNVENPISLHNEFNEVAVVEDGINVSYENEVNKGKHWVPAFLNYQQLREYIELYRMWNCDFWDERRHEIYATQT